MRSNADEARAERRPHTVLVSLGAAAIVVCVLWSFAPALAAGFVSWDDLPGLVENPRLAQPWREFSGWALSTAHMGHWQPLSWLSLRADFAGAADLDQAAQVVHRTNLALHALTSLLVGCVAWRLLECSEHDREEAFGGNAIWALVAALLWALHPLRVESVAWATERRDVLSGALIAGASVAWLRWRGAAAQAPPLSAGRLSGVAACSALALALALAGLELPEERDAALAIASPAALACAAAALCAALAVGAHARTRAPEFMAAFVLLALSLCAKAWGMLVPALWLLAQVHPMKQVRSARELLRAAAELAPFWVLALLTARLALWAQRSLDGAMPTLAEHSLLERALQACYGLGFYFAKSLFPSGLSPLYALPADIAVSEARFAIPALLVPLAAVFAFVFRRRCPGVVAASLAATICVLPVLGFFQAGPQLVADRYTYLFGVPLSVLAAAMLRSWALGSPQRRVAALLVGASIVCTLGSLTRRHTAIWRDTESLWTRVLEVSPSDPTALLALGNEQFRRARESSDPAQAVARLEAAEKLFLGSPRSRSDARFFTKLAMVRDALAALQPEREREHRAQAAAFAEQGLQLALDSGKVGLEARLEHAERQLARGEASAAADGFERASALAPSDVRPWWGLARARAQAGDRVGARSAAERVLLMDPDHAAAVQLLRELDAR